MTNKARSASKQPATQAETVGASVPVVVQGTPVIGAVVGQTEEQKAAKEAAREAEFTANENSLATRISDSGYWWVQDNGAHEQYIGQRPEAMDDARLAKSIQLNPLQLASPFDGREVRLKDGGRFTIQGDVTTVDQIRTPEGEALIGPVDKSRSAARRKAAEAQWKAEDET
jgi:hypothetical protein